MAPTNTKEEMENFPPPEGKIRDLVAKATGFGNGNGKTYEQAKKAPFRCAGPGQQKSAQVGRSSAIILASMAHGLPRSWCNTRKKEKPRTWNFGAFPQSEPYSGMAVALGSILPRLRNRTQAIGVVICRQSSAISFLTAGVTRRRAW